MLEYSIFALNRQIVCVCVCLLPQTRAKRANTEGKWKKEKMRHIKFKVSAPVGE